MSLPETMTVEHKRIIVSETLQWCNDRRKEQGQEPLKELPKGKRFDGVSCPCGNACGLYVGYNKYFKVADKDTGEEEGFGPYRYDNAIGDIPPNVAQFAKGFDWGQFPEYEEKS